MQRQHTWKLSADGRPPIFVVRRFRVVPRVIASEAWKRSISVLKDEPASTHEPGHEALHAALARYNREDEEPVLQVCKSLDAL